MSSNATIVNIIAAIALVLITITLAVIHYNIETTRIHVAAGHVEALGQSPSTHWVAPSK